MKRRYFTICILLISVVTAGCSGGAVPNASGPEPATTTPADTPTTTASGLDGSFRVHFINVGQSDAILVEAPNRTLLMDTGDFTDDGEIVLKYLQQHDIERLDYLVSSHADADHIGGHAAVIEYFETQANGIGAIYDPGIAASTQTYERYLDAVEQYNVTLYRTEAGDSIPFDEASVDVLGPPRPYLANEDRNENSVVLKLRYGETSVLLPGDAEQMQEADPVERYGSALESTVLRAAHHGSKSSSTDAFLDAVDPEAVVITSAYESQYGHPNEVVLERFAERDLPTYWTATHGTTVLTSNGTAITIATQATAPTNPLSLRDGSPIEPGTTGAVQPRATITGGQVTQPVTDGGTTTEPTSNTTESLTVEEIHADAAGDDRDNLTDEYVVFSNTGDAVIDLSGWTVRDEAGKTYTFPDGVDVAPGESLTLHTGSGTDTESDLYWGMGSPVWNNAGDTVIVTNSEGTEILRESYL